MGIDDEFLYPDEGPPAEIFPLYISTYYKINF